MNYLFRTPERLLQLLVLLLALPHTLLAKPLPKVFKAGHYRLADGVLRKGTLCLVSDNELLVKSADTARIKKYAAVDVKNFVIATDSFAVLRGLDIVVNEVVTRYSYAMVQVLQASPALRTYRFQGPLEVFAAPMNPVTKNILRGVAGGAVGVATGMLADELTGASEGKFKAQVVRLVLVQQGAGAVLTIQPGAPNTREAVEKLVADDAELKAYVHRIPRAELTADRIEDVFAKYLSRATARSSKS